MTSHPDMQKIRITGFFFVNRLHWQFYVGEKILPTDILGDIFNYVQTKHQFIILCTSMCLTNGGNISAIKRCSTIEVHPRTGHEGPEVKFCSVFNP
jgi:hypothetical protein